VLSTITTPSVYLAALYESFKSVDGILLDQKLVETKPWDFKLSDISLDKVYIIHDKYDNVVPFSVAKYTQQSVKGSKLLLAQNGGHLLFYTGDNYTKIMQRLTMGEDPSMTKRNPQASTANNTPPANKNVQ